MADNTTIKVVKTVILLRSSTAEEWASVAETFIPRQGEACVTIDKINGNSLKIGDGERSWNELPYIAGPLCTLYGNNGPSVPSLPLYADDKTLQIVNNVISIIGADDDENIGKSFRINETATGIEWFVAADDDTVQANKTLFDALKQSVENDYYTKEQTDALVTKVFKFMGTKNSKAELDAIENPNVGDVWSVKVSSTEANLYVYVEDEDGNKYWEDFPLAIDLENYVLTTDFTPIKTTVESLPETLFSRITASTNATGISISANTSTKNENGVYVTDGVKKVLDIKPVAANSAVPGLMTGADKAKLDSLSELAETGGQANIIENVQVGGVNLPVGEGKTVNIPVAGESLGVVKNHAENVEIENKVVIAEDGTMSVPEINIGSLVSSDGSGDLVLDGGSAID